MKLKRFLEALKYDLGGQKDKSFKWKDGKEKDKYRKIIMILCFATIVLIPVGLWKYKLRKEDNFGMERTDAGNDRTAAK